MSTIEDDVGGPGKRGQAKNSGKKTVSTRKRGKKVPPPEVHGADQDNKPAAAASKNSDKPDDDSKIEFDLTSGADEAPNDPPSSNKGFRPSRPGSRGDIADNHPQGDRQRQEEDAQVIPREELRQAPASHLQAVDEAYRPLIEAEDETEGLDIARYWRIVNRHRWGILSVTLIVLIVGVLNAVSKTPIYRAQTTLVAEPFQRKMTLKDEYINSAATFLFYDTQFDIIKSRAISERVVDSLDLVEMAKQAREKALANGAEAKDGLLHTIAGWFYWRNWINDQGEQIEVAPPDDEELRETLVAQVRGGVTVRGGSQSQIINISYEANDARTAARLADAIANAYVNYGRDTRFEASQRTNKWLQDQIIEVRTDLKQAEASLLAYQEKTGLVDTRQQQTVSNDRIMQISDELVDLSSRRAEAKLRYEQARDLASGTTSIENVTSISRNNNITAIALDVSKLERELGGLRSRVTESHPELKETQVQLAEALKALDRELDKIVNTLRNEYEVADSKVRLIQGQMDFAKQQINDETGLTLELARLEREVENHRKLYDALLVRLQEADVTGDLDASNIQVLDTASVPQVPFKPNKTRIIMLAGILGLGLGILLAFLREHLDRTLKTLDDIEEKLGLTALGMIPLVKAKSHRPETEYLDNLRSPFAEKVNHIRTGLLFSSIDNPPRTILITSTTGGEGKTTLAANLAASLSQLDRTLLLEVDLRKPALAQRLHLTERQGLTDLIADPGLANKLIKPLTDNDTLYLLAAGTRPPNPLELLSSQQFQLLLQKLSEYFRYIVLDGPPLLAVSDAAVLGHLVDTTIMAARAESTSLKMIQDALSLLRKARVNPEGVVLTQADSKRMAYYGGHYYYDKRYYGEEQDAERVTS